MSGPTLMSALEGREVNLANVLHGEQYLEILGDLPVEGTFENIGSVAEVLDKGSGAVVVSNSNKIVYNC